MPLLTSAKVVGMRNSWEYVVEAGEFEKSLGFMQRPVLGGGGGTGAQGVKHDEQCKNFKVKSNDALSNAKKSQVKCNGALSNAKSLR